MKIDNNNLGPLIKKPGEQPGATRPVAPEPESKPETGGDVVQLSERARLAARATELAQGAPDVRQDKVDDLKARLSAGTYNVSGQVVAEAMLRKSVTEV
ncbi:MAG: flagellar biosynthesis anti-sigma factor FlgM [Candidatus Adiutrix sp.]|jgi:negative regulator of flagellin synthesis FlgM|nr:flagellar biosynthesis anti-sigma factor FlgM [Candidatus Adiutrix sp.]